MREGFVRLGLDWSIGDRAGNFLALNLRYASLWVLGNFRRKWRHLDNGRTRVFPEDLGWWRRRWRL